MESSQRNLYNATFHAMEYYTAMKNRLSLARTRMNHTDVMPRERQTQRRTDSIIPLMSNSKPGKMNRRY